MRSSSSVIFTACRIYSHCKKEDQSEDSHLGSQQAKFNILNIPATQCTNISTAVHFLLMFQTLLCPDVLPYPPNCTC